jgi:hypothetical protein
VDYLGILNWGEKNLTGSDILHLNLKKKWFDEIARGEKRKEYREYKAYWKKRLEGRNYEAILFRNGYSSNAPEMLVEYRGLRRDGKSRKADYVILLGRVLNKKRWRG